MVYGAFATVPIFLVWIYVSWVVVLLGAVVAAYAPSLQMRVVRRPDTPGQRFELAVALLRALANARTQLTHGMNVEQLSLLLRTEPLWVEPMLETLIGIDWVARLDEGDTARYVLLCDPAVTLAQPLLMQTLLPPSVMLGPFWARAGLTSLTLAEVLGAET